MAFARAGMYGGLFLPAQENSTIRQRIGCLLKRRSRAHAIGHWIYKWYHY